MCVSKKAGALKTHIFLENQIAPKVLFSSCLCDIFLKTCLNMNLKINILYKE